MNFYNIQLLTVVLHSLLILLTLFPAEFSLPHNVQPHWFPAPAPSSWTHSASFVLLASALICSPCHTSCFLHLEFSSLKSMWLNDSHLSGVSFFEISSLAIQTHSLYSTMLFCFLFVSALITVSLEYKPLKSGNDDFFICHSILGTWHRIDRQQIFIHEVLLSHKYCAKCSKLNHKDFIVSNL